MAGMELKTKENLDRVRWLGIALETRIAQSGVNVLLDLKDMQTVVIAAALVKELSKNPSASEMGKKGGSISKGGGRPKKDPSAWSESYKKRKGIKT